MSDRLDPNAPRSPVAAALRVSEERYRQLFEAIPLATVLYDLETFRLLAVNSAALELYGYSQEELLSLRLFDLLAPHEHERLRRIASGPQDGSATPSSIWTSRRKDGSLIEVDVQARPTLENGRRARLFVAADVTERRTLETALRESEERFRAAFQTSPDSICLLHFPDQTIVAINQGFSRLSGWSEAEAVGHTGQELGLWPDTQLRREMLDELAAKGSLRNRRETLGAKGGRTFQGLISATLVEAGGEKYMLSVARDVTDEERAERERFKLHEQLRQAQKMEAVGRLAGGVAHDFNNMMTVITNFADFLLDDAPPGSPMRSDLEQIREAARRAAGLTRQLLAFSRKQLMQPRVIDLNRLVIDVEKMLRRLIGEDVLFSCVLPPGLPPVRVDPGQVEQVLFNLVVNSRDAMPEGGTIVLETGEADFDERYAADHADVVPGRFVMLAVSDTGVGMDAETQRRAFEPFFTTKAGKGTGLGLATVYGIVKQCGGHVWLYSEREKGTTIKIYLPAAHGALLDDTTPPPLPVRRAGATTVLLVEDEDMVREATRTALERAGYRVLQASGGREAIRIAREEGAHIDLLLTDVVMPEIDGRAAAEEIVKIRPGLRVLFMSGYTNEAIVHHGVLDENIAFIEKPFTQERLSRRVEEVLAAPQAPLVPRAG
jgi:PAS domain S-box-containing protein